MLLCLCWIRSRLIPLISTKISSSKQSIIAERRSPYSFSFKFKLLGEDIFGHSLWPGGATHLAIAGIPNAATQVPGGQMLDTWYLHSQTPSDHAWGCPWTLPFLTNFFLCVDCPLLLSCSSLGLGTTSIRGQFGTLSLFPYPLTLISATGFVQV